MSTWTFTLLFNLPSANRHGGAATNARHAANAAMYRRQRGFFASLLKAEAHRLGIPMAKGGDKPVNLREPFRAVPFRSVTITRLWGKGCRAWDDDNMVAACKGLRDAMQRERFQVAKGKPIRLIPGAGLVWDDSAKWSAWHYAQEKAPDGKPGVRVTVSEVGP